MLLDMQTYHGLEFLSPLETDMVQDDPTKRPTIDEVVRRGEERTAELNSKYEGLNFDDLSNFKSETMIQQWEGEDFQSKVRSPVCIIPLLAINRFCCDCYSARLSD